jgi:hypothetical protein
VEAAKAIVTKLKLKQFAPVENPVLQSTYRMIEEYAACTSKREKIFFVYTGYVPIEVLEPLH